jgi:hypothetical protein
MTMQNTPLLLVFRGPILIGAVTVTLLVPFLSQLSVEFILQLTILVCGVLFTCRDVAVLLHDKLRYTVGNALDTIVLDDVLRSIYDPQVGIIATCVATAAGNATMYALPMDTEQRTQLIQASLRTNHDQAQSILSRPGGCKVLLPEPLQKWLQKGDIRGEELHEKTMTPMTNSTSPRAGRVPAAEADSDCSSEDDNILEEDEPNMRASFPRGPRNVEQHPAFASHNNQHEQTQAEAFASVRESFSPPIGNPTMPQTNTERNPTDPVEVMVSILRDMVSEKLRLYAQYIPESLLETIGLFSAVALALHLGCRRHARRTVFGTLEGALALGLSGAATGACSALFAKQFLLGTIRDGQSLQIVSKAIVLKMWIKLKRVAQENKRMQGILAALVLLYVGRRRSKKLNGSY